LVILDCLCCDIVEGISTDRSKSDLFIWTMWRHSHGTMYPMPDPHSATPEGRRTAVNGDRCSVNWNFIKFRNTPVLITLAASMDVRRFVSWTILQEAAQ
jgi:hypothetical protein